MRIAEVVPQSRLSRIGISEVQERSRLATTKILRRGDQARAATVVRYGSSEAGITLHFPVGRPLRRIIGSAKRCASIEAEDVRELPTADNLLDYAVSVATQQLA